jgi:16S rRNA (cytosine967-C5)-methyltransferase
MGAQFIRPPRPVVLRQARAGGEPKTAERADQEAEKPGLPARMASAKLLAAVVDRRASLDGLTDARGGNPAYLALDARDRLLARAILNAALRFRNTIGALISARLERPLPPNAHTLGHILHVGAAQILFLDVPDSTAVDLAVSHARTDPRTRRFSGLVNGLLRHIARNKDRVLPPALARNRDAPGWLVDRLEAAYGAERTGRMLDMHRVEAPIDLSVKEDADGWAERLGGIVLETGSVRLTRPEGPIVELPGFAEGAWWVQDAAAALPARLLGDVAGLRVADLCAAPGGKTAQLAWAGGQVTAIEKSASRATRLQENLLRLGLNAEIEIADMLTFECGEPFDAVLLDAPCSSTGTIRRHPDVAWTKTPDDVDKLAELQHRMLARAVALVRPGGRLVFSNCSLDPLEGEEIVRRLIAEEVRIEAEPIEADELPGISAFVTEAGHLRTTPEGLAHTVPELSGLDGFFAARFRRR